MPTKPVIFRIRRLPICVVVCPAMFSVHAATRQGDIPAASVVSFRRVTPGSLNIGPLTDRGSACARIALTRPYPNFSSLLKSVPIHGHGGSNCLR